MAGPVTAAPKTIATYAYEVCENLKNTSDVIKKERDDAFEKRSRIEKVKYYACTAFAIIGLILAPTFIVLAAINFSATWLVGTLAAAGILVLFAHLRGKFNSISTEEEKLLSQCNNPLGLDKNKDSVPEASALKSHRQFFADLVVLPTTGEKNIEKQKKHFEVAAKFYDSKIKAPELKGKFSTIVVTSLLLEAIQHTFKKEKTQAKASAELAEKLVDQTDFEPSLKNKIKPLVLQLKDQPQSFVERVAPVITLEGGKAKFKMDDIDKLADIAIALTPPTPVPAPVPLPIPQGTLPALPIPTPAGV